MGKATHTPMRSMRIPDDVWRHAQECAAAEGISVTEYVVRALKRWRPKVVTPPSEPSR